MKEKIIDVLYAILFIALLTLALNSVFDREVPDMHFPHPALADMACPIKNQCNFNDTNEVGSHE